MISKALIRTTIEQSEKVMMDFRDLINEQAYFHIFPFEIQGCVNVTEFGLKPEALNVSDYTYFSKVIGGDMPVVSTWEQSTYWVGSKTRYKHMQNEMGAKIRRTVGKFMMGAIESDVQGLAIASNNTYGAEMSNLQESQEFSLLCTTKLKREDIFKLWIVKRFESTDNYLVTPNTKLEGLLDRNVAQYLYLSEARNYYTHSGKFCYTKLVFTSLNDKLADSGYSIANYVQPALPGVGWTWPILKLVEKVDTPEAQKETARPYLGKYIVVDIDAEKTIDVGVWGCQIKIDNTAIVHSIRLTGYPVTWDPGEGDRDKDGNIKYNTGFVFAPRPLFPKYFLPAVNHPLNTQLKAEDNYILVVGIQPVVDFYQEWKENKKSVYDESIRSSYEGHLRTNFAATNNLKFGTLGQFFSDVAQIWKNYIFQFKEGVNPKAPDWPDWIVERMICLLPPNIITDMYDLVFDLPRSIFANMFSRKLPNYGNVNEKIRWDELKYRTWANILSLNAFAHHDIITLPIGINQTITTETLDMVDDATSRLPVVGGVLNWVIKGFHSLVFGKSPSGFKKGGIDDRMKYYGNSMVGLMSKEM